MPQAVLATINPPAIFSTGSEMPKKCSTKRPKNRNVTRMTKTHTPVLRAVRLRSGAVQEEVIEKKMGIPPKGSTMGNRARNVAAAECGNVRRNCRGAWVASIFPSDILPEPWPLAPAQPSAPPAAAAPAPRPLYRAPHSLPELPPRHSRCIRLEHRSHDETRDGAAAPRTPAEPAPRPAAPDSAVLRPAADSFASPVSLPLLPESALQRQRPHSDRARARPVSSQPFSLRCRGRRQSLFRILRSCKAAHQHRPYARLPDRKLSPSAVRRRNRDRRTF